jgi:ribosomal protein S4
MYNFLQTLDFRIDLLLVRTLLVRNVLAVKTLILLKKIFINGIQLTKINYTFKKKDIVHIFFFQFIPQNISRKLLQKNFTRLGLIRKKIIYKKRPFYKRKIKREFSYSFLSKIKVKNFLEINYRVGMAICIRNFFNNENSIKKMKK